MATMRTANVPESDVDPYADDTLVDPYPAYARLREAGGVVRLTRHDVYALPRFREVRAALGDWEVFSSARGVALNDAMNAVPGTMHTDPPVHAERRRILMRPLGGRALKALTDEVTAEAEALAERLVRRGSFDGVADLARHLPMAIVANLVGLPDDGRERMLPWAFGGFDCMGALNARAVAGFDAIRELQGYVAAEAVPHKVKPGSWAAMSFAAAQRGEQTFEQAQNLVLEYVLPSLDTTIQATASAIALFAEHPQAWDAIRVDPALIPRAINEVVRLESPVQSFSRFVTRDHVVDGIALPAGSRVLLMYASANRDERRWADPTRFDLHRRGLSEQLGFGFGPHVCAGQGLARLELRAVIAAPAKRVRRFEVGATERIVNNVLRGYARMEVTVA